MNDLERKQLVVKPVTPHPQSIFETHEDYVSWDKYDQQNELIEELTDSERERAKKRNALSASPAG